MFRVTLMLMLALSLTACSKLLEKKEENPQPAQCSWAQIVFHDFGDGVSRKSDGWDCQEKTGEFCVLIAYPNDPVNYKWTTCAGAVVTDGKSAYPYKSN